MRNSLINLADKLGLTVYKSKNLYFHAAGIDCYYFFKKYYALKNWNTIVDAGANIGQTALKFSRYFPTATIYSFEPVSAQYDQLKNATCSQPKIRTFKMALGTEPSKLEISLFDDSFISSLKLPSMKKELVNVTSLDIFGKENDITHIDLLKSDTEGFELEVLAGAENFLINQAIDFVYIEIGFEKNDPSKVFYQDMTNFLDNFHYRFIGFFEPIYQPKDGFANALFVSHKLLENE